MTDTKELERRIAESGLKKSYIAQQMGISRMSLYNKVSGEREFTTGEVKALCEVLNITRLADKERIFFAD